MTDAEAVLIVLITKNSVMSQQFWCEKLRIFIRLAYEVGLMDGFQTTSKPIGTS